MSNKFEVGDKNKGAKIGITKPTPIKSMKMVR